ncbi:hypothetical protein Dimus_015380 [Dionaea muscipula]
MERNRGLTHEDGGYIGGSVFQRDFDGGGGVLSYMDALQGAQRKVASADRMDPGTPSTVVLGESHRVEQLKRSYVVEWKMGSYAGMQASILSSFLGVRCIRVPLHARCSGTFMAIGQQWGVVLMIEFGSLVNGVLKDGRINILTEVISPLNRAFKLMVDGVEFSCWVVEDYVAMDDPGRKHDSPAIKDLSPSVDGDGAAIPPSAATGVMSCPDLPLFQAEDGLEEDLLSDSPWLLYVG